MAKKIVKDKILDILYDYQKDSVLATDTNKTGIVLLPTGTGKTLLTNTSFSISQTGNIKSEKFYYSELKEFFLDYITYEYIYPRKMIKKHSSAPISGGKLDVFSTMRNRPQKGPGITYRVKDIKNTEDWNIDDIYYTTLYNLTTKYSSNDDVEQINEMKEFLEEKGYIVKLTDVSNVSKVISDIQKCEVGIIHQPIKNTLLDYYNSYGISETFSINAFYTSKFQYVWEELVRESLHHDEEFKSEVKDVFINYRPTRRRFEEGDTPTVYRDLMPDLFSSYNDKYFIGDAKYYNDPENSHFDKEMYIYNQLVDNEYPMCVFVPTSRTRRLDVREQGLFELIVFEISTEDAISDAINGTTNVIDKVHMLISKNTNRW